MELKCETPRRENEPRVDMNSKEAVRLMQRIKYVGSQELSSTQLRKARRAAARKFLESAATYPQWQERVDEIWRYHGHGSNWELEDGQDPMREK